MSRILEKPIDALHNFSSKLILIFSIFDQLWYISLMAVFPSYFFIPIAKKLKKKGLSGTLQKNTSNMSTQVNNIFQSLPELPESLTDSACILCKDEILICGGIKTNRCYSYHILKKQYKYICSYPEDVQLNGHCVLQLVHLQTNPDEIHLLSFGGQGKGETKQTFSMKYKSVWEIDESDHKSENSFIGNKNESNSISQSSNTWIQHDKDSSIGKLNDSLIRVRGLIGGGNNDLLFITLVSSKIEVINLKTMKSLTGILNNTISASSQYRIQYHCFMPLTMNNEKVINQFILFCKNAGVLIKYNEQDKNFTYEELPVCPVLRNSLFFSFAYVYDFAFLFGGRNEIAQDYSFFFRGEKKTSVYKYSMKEKTWNECNFTFPTEMYESFAILNDDTNVHIIGGLNAKDEKLKMHVSANVDQLFEKSDLLKMPKVYELKNEIKRLKLERPYTIPIEKDRVCEDEKENKSVIKVSEEWQKMKTQMEAFEKKLKRMGRRKKNRIG
ncbi:hypothetical protein RFI_37274 [Reticulomyxa filosa]|uniref:Kelch motif family protein n=1 Tax=Reticulomyxa filosa TaxID=46433 RepID=X6LGB1_RETFI|nr:hypothetical protein RFI_37274 [Reticulomyxa filosa]|eukprot:ETO00177.1 hypothetical protein RFI_37274 [Reticulomyxa filosa]